MKMNYGERIFFMNLIFSSYVTLLSLSFSIVDKFSNTFHAVVKMVLDFVVVEAKAA